MKKTLKILIIAVLAGIMLVSCQEKNKESSLDEGIGTESSFKSETFEPQKQPDESKTDEMPETQIQETEETVAETEEIIGYIAPEGWYAPRYETGSIGGGDYNLTLGVMGLKVYNIEKYFGMRPSTWGYYTQYLSNQVAYYQSQNGLDYTGIVNIDTWLKMGFSETDWYNLGTYISPVQIKKSSEREEIVDVFINRSKDYLGTPYVVGASGKPGDGVDCSGLVLQCMYAIGVYPDGIDPVQHSTIEEYNSRLMWADSKLKEVQTDELIPGDLVFYRRPWSNTVCHVAVYIGENECIEALYSEVEVLPLYKDGQGFAIMGCKRVIAD